MEQYVTFETAKLLKEKGFDWEESPFYCEQDRDEWRRKNNYTVPNPCYDPELPFDTETLTVIAPHISLQMAMKWLREEKKLYVNVLADPKDAEKNDFRTIYRMHVYDGASNYGTREFSKYEEACETAIKYCLENLI